MVVYYYYCFFIYLFILKFDSVNRFGSRADAKFEQVGQLFSWNSLLRERLVYCQDRKFYPPVVIQQTIPRRWSFTLSLFNFYSFCLFYNLCLSLFSSSPYVSFVVLWYCWTQVLFQKNVLHHVSNSTDLANMSLCFSSR